MFNKDSFVNIKGVKEIYLFVNGVSGGFPAKNCFKLFGNGVSNNTTLLSIDGLEKFIESFKSQIKINIPHHLL